MSSHLTVPENLRRKNEFSELETTKPPKFVEIKTIQSENIKGEHFGNIKKIRGKITVSKKASVKRDIKWTTISS